MNVSNSDLEVCNHECITKKSSRPKRRCPKSDDHGPNGVVAGGFTMPIFCHLGSPKDVLSLGATCKKLNQISKDHAIWAVLIHLHSPDSDARGASPNLYRLLDKAWHNTSMINYTMQTIHLQCPVKDFQVTESLIFAGLTDGALQILGFRYFGI